MGHPVKSLMIDSIRETFAGVDGCVGVDYRGLPAESLRAFRDELRKQDLACTVVRGALAAKAFAGAPLEPATAFFIGPTALVYGRDEAGGDGNEDERHDDRRQRRTSGTAR